MVAVEMGRAVIADAMGHRTGDDTFAGPQVARMMEPLVFLVLYGAHVHHGTKRLCHVEVKHPDFGAQQVLSGSPSRNLPCVRGIWSRRDEMALEIEGIVNGRVAGKENAELNRAT